MKKKLLSLVLALIMVIGTIPATALTAFATDEDTSGTPEGTPVSSLPTESGTYYLTNDIPLDSGSAWEIPEEVKITLDMNGHSISRWLSFTITNGYVIHVGTQSTLTLLDTSEEKTSYISGGNNYENGGGICVDNFSVLNMTGITVKDCLAGAGGGIYQSGQGKTILTDCNFIGNTVTGHGGGIYTRSNLTMTGCTVSNNTAYGNGGGLYRAYGDGTITDCTFTGNIAGAGGGIYSESTSYTIKNCTISENSANEGGGIFEWQYTANIENSVITKNTAKTGGGLYLHDHGAGSANIRNSKISENTADNGGAAYVSYRSALTLNGCDVVNNTANVCGGGFYGKNTVNATDSSFSGNTSGGNAGLGYFGGGTSSFTNCEINNNRSEHYGGAMFIDASATVSLKGCDVFENSSKSGGGAFEMESDTSALVLEDSSVYGNSIDELSESIAKGGGFYYYQGSVTLKGNVVIEENTFDGALNNFCLRGNKVTFDASSLSANGRVFLNHDALETIQGITEKNLPALFMENGDTILIKDGKLTHHAESYLGAYRDNGDGTHSRKCTECDVYGEPEAHIDEDGNGMCDLCADIQMSANKDELSSSLNTSSAATLYFGADSKGNPMAFRVIGNEKDGVQAPAGCLTLISKDFTASEVPFNTMASARPNAYSVSLLKNAVDGSAVFTEAEQNAIRVRTLSVNSYSGVSGSSVDALLWAPTTSDADRMNENLRSLGSKWWLSSPASSGNSFAALVNYDGSVVASGNAVNTKNNVRTGLYLDMSSVIFVSAASGGKANASVGGAALTNILPSSGGAYKLTMRAPGRNFNVTGCEMADTANVKITYTGANTGDNEFISYYILDSEGNIIKYAKIAKPFDQNGIVVFARPKLNDGDKFYVINEKINNGVQTDYASEPILLKLNGFNVILAGSTDGQTIGVSGSTYYYYVNSDVSCTATTPGVSGLSIADGAEVHIVVAKGATLTCTGADASGRTVGGGAGILVPKNAKLYLEGEGTVKATGGNAAKGSDAANGTDGYHYNDSYFFDLIDDWQGCGGNGGNGGNGGAGAGAGIGTAGGIGGIGGKGGKGASGDAKETHYDRDEQAGNPGTNGTDAAPYGTVRTQPTVNLIAAGGKHGKNGGKGSYGDTLFWYIGDSCHTLTAGTGGGGGQGGLFGPTVGKGGGGGGGGGGGNGGPVVCSEGNYYFVPSPGAAGGGNSRINGSSDSRVYSTYGIGSFTVIDRIDGEDLGVWPGLDLPYVLAGFSGAYKDHTHTFENDVCIECAARAFVIDENGVLTEYNDDKETVVVPEGVVKIDEEVFYRKNVKNITLPSTLTEIGEKAFLESKLTSVVIPASVETIDKRAFNDCKNLTNVTFESGSKINKLGTSAFLGSGLTEINIPETVTVIEDGAFRGCQNLSSVTVNWTEDNKVVTPGSNAFTDIKSGCRLNVPVGKAEMYENKSVWKDFTIIRESEEYFEYNPETSSYERKMTEAAPMELFSYDEDISLGEGWYIVTGDIFISGRLTFTGDAHIILRNGSSLYATDSIVLTDGADISFYAQTTKPEDMGMAVVFTVNDGVAGIGADNSGSCGDITVHGGTIIANGGTDAAGIGGGYASTCGNIAIYGGYIYAEAGENCNNGIGAGNNSANVEVTYGDDVNYIVLGEGETVYVNIDMISSQEPGCITKGYQGVFVDILDENGYTYYSDFPFNEENRIGDDAAYEEWKAGKGSIAPLEHSFVYADEEYHTCVRCGASFPHDDTNDDGKCDRCSAVFYYEYNEKTKSFEMKAAPIDATVLTGNITKDGYYTDEWYIISGDVTADTSLNFNTGDPKKTTHIILENGALLNAKGGIGLKNDTVFYASTLDIEKMGKISVPTSKDHAGIGPEYYVNYVIDIVINGGTYDITAGEKAAGIGGAYRVMNPNITINGGNFVKVYGGQCGAGIGGGPFTYMGSVLINGGTFDRVYGGDGAAAIGGGGCTATGWESEFGDIVINGGTFDSICGGYFAPAIGAGSRNVSGDITIAGGNFTYTVLASNSSKYEGSDGKAGSAAIGSGWNGECGDINISDGYFNAVNARAYGPAIGSGSEGSKCGTVNISGGIFYQLNGGPDSPAIGSGFAAEPIEVNITGGIMRAIGGGSIFRLKHTDTPAVGGVNGDKHDTVNIKEGYEIRNIEESIPGVAITREELDETSMVLVLPGAMPGSEEALCTEDVQRPYYSDTSGMLFYANSMYTYPIGGEEELKEWIAGNMGEYYFDIDNGIKYYRDAEHTSLIGGYSDLMAWLCDSSETGGLIPAAGHDWQYESEYCHKCARCALLDLHADIDTDGKCDGCGSEEEFKTVEFFVYNEETGGFDTEAIPEGYGKILDSSDTSVTLDSDYYVVLGETNIGTLTTGAETHLILTDGATLTVDAKIEVPENGKLFIHATTLEEDDFGKLISETGGIKLSENADITIDGGNITAKCDDDDAAIGGKEGVSCGDITINGGTVTATAGGDGAAIGSRLPWKCGSITITGGEITASSDGGAAIDAGEITISQSLTIEAGDDKGSINTVDSYNGEKYAFIGTAPVSFNTMSLTLDGAIGVNFFVKVYDDSGLGDEAYMEMFLRDGTTKKVMLSDEVYDSQKGKYKFTFYVNSLQMAEEISAVFCYGDGKTIERSTSVKDYAQYVSDTSENEYFANLANAILAYGYYAQLACQETHGFTLGADGKYDAMPVAAVPTLAKALAGGVSTLNCPVCATGIYMVKCPTCEGTMITDCHTCTGTGETACTRCIGSGTEDCPVCYGLGASTCQNCTRGRTASGATCTKCDGHGIVWCTNCNRTGKITCTLCEGEKIITCTACNGKCTQTCTNCTDGKVYDGKNCKICGGTKKFAANLAKSALKLGGANDNIEKLSMSLALDNRTDIYIYVTCADGYTPTVSGVDGATVEKVGARYKITIPNIAAHELADTYSLDIGGLTVDVSVFSYINSVLSSKTRSENYKCAVAALFDYYTAAIIYAK